MFCPTCGLALTQSTKYCNHCGALLLAQPDSEALKLFEKRMDSEMEGLFWSTVFGIGLVVGGMVLLKKVGMSESLIIAYMCLSASAFVTYFGLGVWQVRRLAKSSKAAGNFVLLGSSKKGELGPTPVGTSLRAAPSVTENTTRSLGN